VRLAAVPADFATGPLYASFRASPAFRALAATPR
jgi:hypothetical protein